MLSRIKFCIFAILLIVIECPILLYAQSTPNHPYKAPLWEDLSITYGYYNGQLLSIETIQKQFPDLSAKARQAQMEFDLVFRSSYRNIESTLEKMLGDKWSEYQAQMQEQLHKMLLTSRMTKDQATVFIKQVSLRAKGQIESPVLETFLAYNPAFQRNPVEELNRGFKKTYRTKGHLKAKGLDFQIEYPKSWSSREGNRPNVIQFFRSKNGRGPVSALIMTRDLVQEAQGQLTTQETLALKTLEGSKELAGQFFTHGSLIEIANGVGMKNVRDFGTKRIVLDRCPGAMLEFVGDQ